jgi:hypothetical protein
MSKQRSRAHAKEKHLIDMIERRVAKSASSCDWIKQHKLQQSTVKVE